MMKLVTSKETAVENEVIDNPEIPVKDELQHDVVDVVGHPEKDVVTGLDDDDEDVPPEVNERFIKDEEISNVGVEELLHWKQPQKSIQLMKKK